MDTAVQVELVRRPVVWTNTCTASRARQLVKSALIPLCANQLPATVSPISKKCKKNNLDSPCSVISQIFREIL